MNKNTYRFRDGDINKFCLMLHKGVQPYDYIDCWQRYNKSSLPEKIQLYSDLKMEDVTDFDKKHAKRIGEQFEIQNLRFVL